MAESGTMNSDNKVDQSEKKEDDEDIKTEADVHVKRESLECVVCTTRSLDAFDIYSNSTAVSGATLHHFLNKYTQVDLTNLQNSSRVLCKSCYDLINVLEQAEIEYLKLKEEFDSILSKNPLFESQAAQPIKLSTVKSEIYADDDDEDYVCDNVNEDSDDDMPLSTQSRRKRTKVVKKKKKESLRAGKRRLRSKVNSESWECEECGTKDTVGGADALVAHKLANHAIENSSDVIQVVKTEDSAEGSQSPIFNNGFSNCLKIEVDQFDNDSLTAEDIIESKISKKKVPVGRPRKGLCMPKQGKIKKSKIIHQCDQCDAKYTSLARLEQHKQKHDGSKPPYICEVCGAHYKHKRACDIHIALHKGISDWKCEECNKLFPSKNALQRHNNIHTGKLNYQCDLCGKSFIHTSSFKMHKLSHSGIKPHACDVCGLALMTRSHLKRHKRVHSGEKRHECPICGKRFSERYNLAAHSKSHEAGEPVLPQPRRRLFRCIFCPERFERRYMLERHMQVVHGRALERPPPTPRNTMSKLLKAQAQRRDPTPHSHHDPDTKDDLSSDSTARPIAASKLIAQLSAGSSLLAGAWGAPYAPDFPH